MLPRHDSDCIQTVFDDHRLVANAGLILPATLAHHLGLGGLVDYDADLGGAPRRPNVGDKLLTLVASALAGADCGIESGIPDLGDDCMQWCLSYFELVSITARSMFSSNSLSSTSASAESLGHP